ncbi:hypothetical protein GCM10027612_14830 [Microbispora bryophytorum subsp. camponoti]
MIVIGSGPLIAALNIRDRYHEACARLLQTHPEPLLVPATVVTEVCQLVEKRQGSKRRRRSCGPSGLALPWWSSRTVIFSE